MVKPQKLLYTTLLAISISAAAQGQELKRLSLGIDCGTSTYSTDLKENDAIRATSSVTFFDQSGSYDLRTSTHRTYYGIKAELLSSSGYLGISTGIRYTQVKSEINRDSWFSYSKTKFYVLYNQDGTNTEYAQVEKVTQKADYLGIPLDFRFYTTRPRFFRLFFKLGFDFSMRVGNKNTVDFLTTSMNPYEQQVGRAIGTPSSVLTTFNPGLGFKLGDTDGVNVSFELNAPSYIISTNASTFAKNRIGIGAQLYIYYPIL